ncbi:MAG: peptidylprolyl isomerase [Desulfobulbaceae bacterium]|nr:peptidylprolyl isomerase [Desulfobulbaceae bacterium]
MQTAKPGDTVTVIYDGILENGEIFESSKDTGPLDFQIGKSSVMPGFEQAIIGMKAGETKKIMVEPKEAYGLRQDELVHTLSRSSWDASTEIKPGVVVGMTMEHEGEQHQVPALITEIDGDEVTVDFNHPLAGKKIIYQITLQAINGAGNTELTNDCSSGSCGCSS